MRGVKSVWLFGSVAIILAPVALATRVEGLLKDKMSVQGLEVAKKAVDCATCARAVGGSKASAHAVRAALEGLYLYGLDLGSVRESADAFEINVAERRGKVVYLNCGDVFFSPANVPLVLEGGETVSLLMYHERLIGLVDGSLTAEKFQAIYLLHELGHVLRGLPRDFGKADLSFANTKTVIQKCFRELLTQ